MIASDQRANSDGPTCSTRRSADDRAIHDTVLIAAAFCMFNRYVDGLATWAPSDPAVYERIGVQLGEGGYLAAIGPETPPVPG